MSPNRFSCLVLSALLMTAAGLLADETPPKPLRMAGDHWTAWDPPTSIPEGTEVYIVQRGDTLWDLATQFYGDPYLWPQLWERNSYILDAHWIYPGDPLVVGVEVTPVGEVLSPAVGEMGPEADCLSCHVAATERPMTAFWNSWLVGTEAGATKIVEYLEPKTNYTLNFDLAPIDYRLKHVASARADPDLEDALRVATSFQITVRARILGTAAEIINPIPTVVEKVDVDLKRLKDKPERKKDDESLESFSMRVRAAQFAFDLRGRKKGCAKVVISITEFGDIRPLDHLVRTVRVADRYGNKPWCSGAGETREFSAGLRNLLSYRNALEDADAGLHIVESMGGDGNIKAAAFFIQKSTSHWSWELRQSLSGYLRRDGSLQKALNRARNWTAEDPATDYSNAARQLEDRIFKGRGKSNTEAKKARKALSVLVEQSSGKSPTLLVRLVDKGNRMLFVPLRLLSLTHQSKGGGMIPLNVVYPLPSEEYSSPEEQGCVKSWWAAIPDKIQGVDVEVVPTPVELKSDPFWIHKTDQSLTALKTHLLESTDAAGEGLVILAHHSKGEISYLKSDNPIMATDIERSIKGGGGVAVLMMCNTAAVEDEELTLLKHLSAELKIGAVILSPFKLDAHSSKLFALRFFELARQAQTDGKTSSLTELLEQASSSLESNPKARHMPYELLIAGNHTLRLCKQGGTQ